MKKAFLILFSALCLCAVNRATAQVTIGSTDNPQEFSILELVSNSALGLRLPQMTIAQRNAMVATGDFQAEKNDKARGLQIFNTTTKCVETWNGAKWIEQCGEPSDERIELTIETTDGQLRIPRTGYVSGIVHSYDWNIFVDGEYFSSATGKASDTSDDDGILLEGLSAGKHKIRITPNGAPAPGWGNAFGFYNSVTGSNVRSQANRDKIISVDAPLTTMAFAPDAGTGNASYMFAYTFYSCKKLETGIKIKDTYKLPATITNLSRFLYYTHYDNTVLEDPVDLSGISGWFSGNSSITNLSFFLNSTHSGNTSLEKPVNLSWISGWFSGNSSITTLYNFLDNTHSGNISLKEPVDLSWISGWFSGNSSITNLSGFLYSTHSGNTVLEEPVDLSWISGWFSGNSSIKAFSDFLAYTHSGNNELEKPVDLSKISGWFSDNSSITDLSYFLKATHSGNTSLKDPVDLNGISGWFSGNSSITNLSDFLAQTHSGNIVHEEPVDLNGISGWFSVNSSITNLYSFLNQTHSDNTLLTDPVDLSWISGWFIGNSSITNLSYFLSSTHNGNTSLTEPVDITHLSGWFSASRNFSNLAYFLYRTHYNNTALKLTGQTIFPDWIQTATYGSSNSPVINESYSFNNMFSLISAKGGDTGEPKFEDGNVLSSLGTPSSNKETYKNRTGIILPANSNWQ
jgi:hypothetical protein